MKLTSIPVLSRQGRGVRNDPEERAVVLAGLWRDVEAARRALARGRKAAIEHTARGLITALVSARVRVELAYAAAAFADALDERPDAEAWVEFAVTARATLEHAMKAGASILASELAELDESFEDARDAVLLLEPEDYKEALCGMPPSSKAWWCERARVDGTLREIDLERALGKLAAG
jgi:hypothetical protein